MTFENRELMKYACEKFEEGIYDEALESFILLYMRGYEQEWIIETIYNCYMTENDAEFRKTFRLFAEKSEDIYEECMLDFIPYRDGEYYIFDKKLGIFRGVFSVPDLKRTDLQPVFQEMEFSGAVLELDWNWNKEKPVLAAAGNRKIYAICHDRKRCMSFFKIPELAGYIDNIRLFSDVLEFQDYFHQNTSAYLPRILLGNKDIVEKLDKIIDQEHQYRLTPEGRNIENILLTIGIPTCNRGNLLLKRLENLRKMFYDSEIEIVVSKNGTEYYQSEYEEASRIPDARINYYGYDRTLKIVENWHHVVEMAHGKYVLFVSDEDDVVTEALEHYLRVLKDNSDASLVRARTVFQNSNLEREYAKKGIEALKLMFLTQNYLSGLIIRKKDFIEENLLNLEEYEDNVFYKTYPHEWWCALLTRKGDAMTDSVTLISEGDSVLKEETKAARETGTLKEDQGIVEGANIPVYATYQARLEQFRGCVDFIHIMLRENTENVMVGLEKAICKTTYLLLLARGYKYKCESYESMVGKFCKMAMGAIDEFPLEDEQKIYLLNILERCCLYVL